MCLGMMLLEPSMVAFCIHRHLVAFHCESEHGYFSVSIVVLDRNRAIDENAFIIYRCHGKEYSCYIIRAWTVHSACLIP